jgi:hypothetical protein
VAAVKRGLKHEERCRINEEIQTTRGFGIDATLFSASGIFRFSESAVRPFLFRVQSPAELTDVSLQELVNSLKSLGNYGEQ